MRSGWRSTTLGELHHAHLRHRLEQDRGDGRKSHTVRFFDFDKPNRNEWIVTRQYKVLGSKKHVIPDIVVFVNGPPLAVVECKSPTIGDTWKAEAVKQLHRYQEAGSRWKDQGAPKLFEAAQVLVATCGERAVYGTVGTPERFFLEWKEPYPLTVKQLGEKLGRPPTPQDILLFGLLGPRNLLDIVRNFVVFEVDGGRTVRKLTRYKQFIAVNEAMRRIRTARKPSARGGIVWHTQGSGKSLTMLWLALKLRRDESQQQPTVVIVTDRTKLDRQIAGVFTACGFPNPERADSVRDLRRPPPHRGDLPGPHRPLHAVHRPERIQGPGVATSRHAAVTYKEALDRLNAPESAVIMSAGHNDETRLAHRHLRREEQDRLIERFKDRDDPLAILVVCDMLLTGFDAPIEQVMYLDAPLKEHTLLQAIARVNRPQGDEKTYGLVVDYWGVSAKLQDALAIFSTTDVQGALTPSVDELPRLQSRHATAMRFFQSVADPNDLNACVQVLEPEDVRAAFDLAFRRFSQSMDMLLPDRRALAYHGDLRWLGKIRGAARARYRDDRLDLSGCGEKVRKLIADAVAADGVQILVMEVQLFSPEFEAKVEALRTDEAKASEMEHAIRHEISIRLEENPAFYQSLRERLEAIIEERRQERLDAARQLSLLNSLREELKGEQTRAQDIGLDTRGFAIYGLLEEQRPMPVREDAAPYNVANRDLASLIDDEVAPFTELVDWWQKDDLQRQMRSKIKRQLRASGIEADAVESLAADIVDLAKVRTDR